MKNAIFWDITLCSPLKVNRHFGGTYCLCLQGPRIRRERNQLKGRRQAELVFCLDYSSTLKMEATCSPEKSVDFQRTTRRYIPDDSSTLRPFSYRPIIKCTIKHKWENSNRGIKLKKFKEISINYIFLKSPMCQQHCKLNKEDVGWRKVI
jgi:hypothetical protein